MYRDKPPERPINWAKVGQDIATIIGFTLWLTWQIIVFFWAQSILNNSDPPPIEKEVQMRFDFDRAEALVRNSDRLLIGQSWEDGSPAVLPTELLENGHGLVSGMTGTGKTAKVLMPLACQFIRADTIGQCEVGPVVFFDFKAKDNETRATLLLEAKRAGKGFDEINTDSRYESACWNPIEEMGEMTVSEHSACFRESAGLVYPFGYGSTYFTQRLAELFETHLERCEQKGIYPRDLKEQADLIESMTPLEERRDAQSIIDTLRILGRYPQFSAAPEGANKVSIKQVIEEKRVVLFRTPNGTTSLSGQIFMRWFLNILSRHMEWYNATRPVKTVALAVIDEANILINAGHGDLAAALQTMRSSGVSLLFSTQAFASEAFHDPRLWAEVLYDVGLKVHLRPSPDLAELLSKEGGTHREWRQTSTTLRDGPGFWKGFLDNLFWWVDQEAHVPDYSIDTRWTETHSEEELPNLDPNDIRKAASRGAGVVSSYALPNGIPRILYPTFVCDRAEFQRRRLMTPPLAPPRPKNVPPAPSVKEIDTALEKLAEKQSAMLEQLAEAPAPKQKKKGGKKQ